MSSNQDKSNANAANPAANINDYELSYLVDHLLLAGQLSEVNRLLLLPTVDRRNAWYEVKDTRIGTSEYRADIRKAWTACQENSKNFVAECRYALTLSSLNGLAQKLPPEMVSALVKQRVWNLPRAIAYAQAIPELENQVEAKTRLIPFIDKSVREKWIREILESALNIDDVRSRAEGLLLLVSLIPKPKPSFLFEGLFENARTASTPHERQHAAQLLIDASKYIPISFLLDAIDCYRAVKGESPLPLLLLLHEPDRSVSLQTIISDRRAALKDESGVADFVLLVPALAGKIKTSDHQRLVGEAYEAVLANKENKMIRFVIPDLIPYLPPPQQKEAFLEILAELKVRMQEWNQRARNELISLTAVAPPQLQEEIISAVSEISDERLRLNLLFAIAPSLQPFRRKAILDELLEVAPKEKAGQWLAEDVEALAPYFSQVQLRAALKIIQESWLGSSRVRGLTAMASVSKGKSRASALNKAMAQVQGLPDHERDLALKKMVPILNKRSLSQVLGMLNSLDDAPTWLPVLPRLAAHLPEAQRPRVWRLGLSLTPELENEWPRWQLVSQMSRLLPPTMLTEALAVARAFESPRLCASALGSVSALIPEVERTQFLEEAVNVAEGIHAIEERLSQLTGLLEWAPSCWRDTMLDRITTEIEQVKELQRSAPIFLQLSRFLPEPRLSEMLIKALQAPQPSSRTRRVVPLLAPILPEPAVRWLLWSLHIDRDPAKSFELYKKLPQPSMDFDFSIDDHERDESFTALVVRLSELADPIEAYQIALKQRADGARLATIAAIAGRLPGDIVRKNFEGALQLPASAFDAIDISRRRKHDSTGTRQILGAEAREYILVDFCGAALRNGNEKEVLEHVRSMEFPEYRAEALVQLAAYLRGANLEAVIKDAVSTLEQVRSGERRHWLQLVDVQLAKLSSQVILDIVRSALISQSRKTRDRQIETLCCLSGALFAYDGYSATEAVLEAVESVAVWWP